MQPRFLATLGTPLVLLCPSMAEDQLSFSLPQVLSVEGVPGAPDPGEDASKVKLVRLFNTPMGANDGRLVAVYADANSPGDIWHPRDGVRRARDIFATYSDDDGTTWTDPVNISNTAGSWSALTDWDGDGSPEEYWGDSGKPTIFNNGNNIVVSWSDKYCPEEGWTFGQDGQSTVQGSIEYPDITVFPEQREVPFACVMLAISNDGGATWVHGELGPPLQLTYGRRDCIQDNVRGAGPRWFVTWQEDPEGLQPGEADGPGEGASGAKVTKGTDIWYGWTADLVNDPFALRTNRIPISNNSQYDTTASNGYPIVGQAGSIENHGSSRANSAMVRVGTAFWAVVAYEETKGIPDVVEGKTVQYHAFPFDQPPLAGTAASRSGSSGTILTPLLENARRVRFVPQPPNGTDPAMVIFWRQGVDTEGGPGDIMCKVSTAIDEAAILAAPVVNLSAETPVATSDNLDDSPTDNPYEDARAHRAVVTDSFVAVGYSYTPNGPLARYTDLENYNFWLRRSFDGGQTWDSPVNLSNITNTKINVKEPRLVEPANSGTQQPGVLVIGWGTETNVYEGLEEVEPLDAFITRTDDYGDSYGPIVRLTATDDPEFESQIRMNDDASRVYATIMQRGPTPGDVQAVFTRGTLLDVPDSVGTLFCWGNGTGIPCPCGNESDPGLGAGCANSTGLGMVLTASGSESLAAANLAVDVTQGPIHQPALLVASPEAVNGALGAPFADGVLCFGSPTIRFGALQMGASGSATWGPDLLGGLGLMPGSTLFFQAWYRDPSGPCGGGSNLSSGVELHVAP